MNKVLLTTLLFLSVTSIGFSQTFDKTKLDTYFQVLEKNNKFMGSVALSKNGELIYTKSIGYARRSCMALHRQRSIQFQ